VILADTRKVALVVLAVIAVLVLASILYLALIRPA
jgi:hypothetical protein